MKMHYDCHNPLARRKRSMTTTLEALSTLTDRYQTTVPQSVRRALRLGKRDRIRYTVRPGGEVVLSRAPTSEETDPALGAFLDFLSRDIAQHPQQLHAVNVDLVKRLKALTKDVDIDLEAPLPTDAE